MRNKMKLKVGRHNDAYNPEEEIEGKYKPYFTSDETNQNINLNNDEDQKKKEEDEKKELVNFTELFQFSSKRDKAMMVIGTIAALGNGALLPIMLIVFGQIIDGFVFDKSAFCSINGTALNSSNSSLSKFDIAGQLSGKIRDQSIYLVFLGIATMILSFFQVSFWLMPAERQTRKIRVRLFESILRQDIGWFDIYKSGELTNRLTDDVNKIKDGISDKLGNAIQYFSTFLSGIIIGFIKGWKLTLVVLSLAPILFAVATVFSKIATALTTSELKAYAKAGAVAEEVFTAIRTVFAFNGVKKEHKRYESKLDDARTFGIKKSAANGLILGILWLVINCGYALGFWYGWKLTTETDQVTGKASYTVGTILIVFFSIIISIFSLGNAAPYFATLTSAKAAAFEVFDIIKRIPPIDIESNGGEILKEIKGDIKFRNVSFKYPSRPTVQILNNLNLHIQPGKIVALVGASGCGKSTCIQLLQRFYDPLSGDVLIDDKNLKDLNINWWRTHIGVVNQEPVLFATTIADNIRMGKDNATQQEIEEAAKNANAHDFIMKLPDKYETLVGNRGSQLSGGQKQRIAIARALIRDPKILLLDEATSALDNESESIVQAALDKASLGRTTIIIAHRLSTIRNADIIYAMQKGQLVESGTHNELMEHKGIYYNLVTSQQTSADFNNELKTPKTLTDEVVEQTNESIGRRKSVAASEKSNKKDKKEEKKQDISMLQLLSLNKPEWYFILIGSIGSLISGAIQPAFAVIFSKILTIFQECSYDKQKESVTIYCVLFLIFGIVSFCSYITTGIMFGVSGENLTKRLRSKGFKAMLSQDVSWFDDPKNNVGVLCTRLSTEAAAVQGATGSRVGYVLMSVGNLGVGIVLAFIYGWALTLVILGFLPLLIAAGALQTKMLTGFSSKDKQILEEAGKITNEAISSIRTVSILNKEKKFINDYAAKVKAPFKAAIRSANLFAFMLGLTNSITYYANAAAFSFGAFLVEKNLFGMNFEKVMLVFSVLVFGAQSAGQAASFLPDYAKAKAATITMLELFALKPKINNWEPESTKTISDDKFNGDIVFHGIQFHYPTRPNVKVLNNLELRVRKGQRVALVGPSGCGKSTVTQLLERFYNPDHGSITVSDVNVNELDTRWLRAQIGLVSQEPILFDTTIAENIAYGCEPGTYKMDNIIEAAKQANIHNFISKLPKGYETNVGSKGAQLSGGEKQRIAIARALIRNPRILLLDEATSALDNEAEKIVEEALEKAQEGRTCIVIAHRLSTIKNADVIYVIRDGAITESGTHDELMELGGFYAKLNRKRNN